MRVWDSCVQGLGSGGYLAQGLKETTGGEFRVYRASTRLLQGIETFYKAPITVTTHLKMS